MDVLSILYPVLSLGGLALLFGLGLGYAGVKFKVNEDPRIPLVRDALPGANCGGCGFAGCDALAAAIVEGKAKPNACPVGGDASARKISEIVGLAVEIGRHMVAFVRCNGNSNTSVFWYDYVGMQDCRAETHLAAGGPKACGYGCLGSGSCARVCRFGAITVVDGVAVVDREKCTACGVCVQECPKGLIAMVPYDNYVRVACNSRDNGKAVRANCSVGCIGCRICERACGYDAVHVNEFVARIDYGKCELCGDCAGKCPTKAIVCE
ncbi:MAG: RnfABCDGE type electron transport complex subunit B [Clostridiales bacterium]|jgi:Na+-translocating ferredoxin:NAD+ oxidoreductase RNF subunit RnfB|nr:RnfABCDGE type electron transport complex subunit B [Clostridiales bacterium]